MTVQHIQTLRKWLPEWEFDLNYAGQLLYGTKRFPYEYRVDDYSHRAADHLTAELERAVVADERFRDIQTYCNDGDWSVSIRWLRVTKPSDSNPCPTKLLALLDALQELNNADTV